LTASRGASVALSLPRHTLTHRGALQVRADRRPRVILSVVGSSRTGRTCADQGLKEQCPGEVDNRRPAGRRSADEVHLSQIATHVIAAFRADGTTRGATGAGLL